MIQDTDRQLQEWAQACVNDVTVTLHAPLAAPEGQGVSLYLYQIADGPPARSITVAPPLRVLARYLVTTWAATPEQAHALLETLLFAALEDPAYEVDLAPLDPALWTGLGVMPQPAFVLNVPVTRPRAQPATPRVRQPLEVETALLVAVHGQVLGPGDVPIAHAQIAVPALDLSLQTDRTGRFALTNLPAGRSAVTVHVRAKGDAQTLSVSPADYGDKPLIIRFTAFD